MNVFQLVGTFAIKGADKAKADIKSTASTAKSEFAEMGGSAKKHTAQVEEGFERSAKATNPLIEGVKKVGAAIAAYMSVQAVKDFANACVEAAATVAAENSAFEQIMGDYSEQAQAKMQAVADATGVVDTRLTSSMTSMTAKFKGLGFGVEDATDLAARGLTIASDAAAFWDKSLTDSQSALNSFINGSYEGGEAIGLFANDTQMAAYAVEKGIVSSTKEWSALDEATKQATRLEYAENMMALSGATGQAAKEASQYANVKANLTEKWRQFQAKIGEPVMQNVVIPAMNAISGLLDRVTPKIEALTDQFGRAKDALAGWFDGMMELASSAETPAEAVKLVFSNLSSTITGILTTLATLMIERFVNMFTMVANMLPTLIPILTQAALTLFYALVDAIPQILPLLVDAVMSLITTATELLPTLAPMLLGAAITLFMAIVQSIPTILNALIPAVSDLINRAILHLPTFLGTLLSTAVALFMAIAQAVPQVAGAVLGAVSSLLSQIPGVVAGFAGSMATAGRNLIAGMVSGITSAGGQVWSAITRICSNALGAIKSFFGIASPSKVMKELFRWIPIGGAEGIDEEGAAVERSMVGMARNALSKTQVVIDEGLNVSNPVASLLSVQPSMPQPEGYGYGAQPANAAGKGDEYHISITFDISKLKSLLENFDTFEEFIRWVRRTHLMYPTRR